jgi:GT2 family glycosyltransferase
MKVSIIIPYKEDRGFLHEAVESAKHQIGFVLGKDYEIIQQQGDALLSVNYNNAVKRAKGKYIKILADDDVLTSDCLQTLYPFAEEGKYDVVCAGAINFTEDGYKVQYSYLPVTIGEFAIDNPIHGGTVLYRRDAFIRVGGMDEKMWTCEEFDLHLRMMKAGCKFGVINKIVYKYRVHADQKSGRYWAKDPETGVYRFEYKEAIQNKWMNDQQKIVTLK